MKTYWCSKKNSIVAWINKGIKFDIALEPCIKEKCECLDDGWCIHMSTAGGSVKLSASWLPIQKYQSSITADNLTEPNLWILVIE